MVVVVVSTQNTGVRVVVVTVVTIVSSTAALPYLGTIDRTRVVAEDAYSRGG